MWAFKNQERWSLICGLVSSGFAARLESADPTATLVFELSGWPY